MAIATEAIPQTHCVLCGRQINGDKPRICAECANDTSVCLHCGHRKGKVKDNE